MTDRSFSTLGRRAWRGIGVATIALGLTAAALPATAATGTATLTGTVVGVDGGLDTHGVVHLSPEGGGSIVRTEVEADGTFEIDGVAPGRYYVTAFDDRRAVDAVYGDASWDGRRSVVGSYPAVTIVAGTTQIAFELPFRRGVVVTALDEAGNPLPRMSLQIEYDENGTWRGLAHDAPITDASGRAMVPLHSTTVRFCVQDLRVSGPQYGTVCSGGGSTITSAAPISVGPNDRKIQVELRMPVVGAPAVGTVTIDGPLLPQVKNSLVARVAGWPSGATLTYQWYRNGQLIHGANASFYVIRASDAGGQLSVQVTATAPGKTPVSVMSTPTRIVGLGGIIGPPGGSGV